MLSRDFQNGKKVSLPSALAVFTIIMGILFLIDASSGVQALIAGLLVLFGVVWYVGQHTYAWWHHHQPH